MKEYRPNLDTGLPWPEVLELLNKLLDWEIDSSSNCGELEYILVEINNETKDILNKLGVKLEDFYEEFYDLEEGWIDITPLVWNGITWHYGQELWYTGKEFVVWSKEQEEMFELLKDELKEMTRVKNLYCHCKDKQDKCSYCQRIKRIRRVVDKYKEGKDEKN